MFNNGPNSVAISPNKVFHFQSKTSDTNCRYYPQSNQVSAKKFSHEISQ